MRRRASMPDADAVERPTALACLPAPLAVVVMKAVAVAVVAIVVLVREAAVVELGTKEFAVVGVARLDESADPPVKDVFVVEPIPVLPLLPFCLQFHYYYDYHHH